MDFGGYWLVEVETVSAHRDRAWRGRRLVAGGEFGISLDEVEAWLADGGRA